MPIDFDTFGAQILANFALSLEGNRPGCTTGNAQGLPSLSKRAFTETWISEMENDFYQLVIPSNYWVHLGIAYLPDGLLKNVVESARQEIRRKTKDEWTWDDFKAAVIDFNALAAQFIDIFGPQLDARPTISTYTDEFPPLTLNSFTNTWVPNMENKFTSISIPESEWIYGGMLYLVDGTLLKTVVEKTMKKLRADPAGGGWTWDDYKRVVAESIVDYDALQIQFQRTYGRRLRRNRRGLPTLDRDSFVNIWIPTMENTFASLMIPNSEWVYGGILYLPEGQVKDVVKKARDEIRRRTGAEWTWDDYKTAVVEVIDLLEKIGLLKKIGKGVVLGVTLGPPLIVGALGVLGFGAAGVGAGSVAAIVQSVVYRGATGGLFSVLQSVGASGAVGAVGTAVTGGIGGAVANFFARRR